MTLALAVIAVLGFAGLIAGLVLIAGALHRSADASAAIAGAIRERTAQERRAWEAERRETRHPWEEE